MDYNRYHDRTYGRHPYIFAAVNSLWTRPRNSRTHAVTSRLWVADIKRLDFSISSIYYNDDAAWKIKKNKKRLLKKFSHLVISRWRAKPQQKNIRKQLSTLMPPKSPLYFRTSRRRRPIQFDSFFQSHYERSRCRMSTWKERKKETKTKPLKSVTRNANNIILSKIPCFFWI